MKHLARTILAVFLAVLMGTQLPVQVFADTPDYISEVKVFAGDYSAAQKEGYTLLKDGNTPVDLNQDAGGGLASKGEKAVYLGYKTTKNRKEAITDLALMNMKGGYDVKEYEALYQRYIDGQIKPFIENFRKTISEYRENYNSKNAANKARATYVHDALNKFIDDDTGKGLGDLFLEQTKEEMGDAAYNALSPEEKREHADLTTILSQANGNATLLMQNLLVRAADSNSNTWLERMSELTYDDLLDQTGLSPTDAAKRVAKKYDDAAQSILDMWDDLSTDLNAYDANVKAVNEFDFDACQKAIDDKDTINENTSEAQKQKILDDFLKAVSQLSDITAKSQAIAVHDALAEYDYLDGTMLDFFTQSKEEIEDDITVLYPMAAVLTNGQKAGLDIISLRELCIITLTDGRQYKSVDVDFMDKTSIYDGVDRAIYEKGGVALTTEARRKDALAKAVENSNISLSWWTIGAIGLTIVSATVLIGSVRFLSKTKSLAAEALDQYDYVYEMIDDRGYNALENTFLSKDQIIQKMKSGYPEVYNNYNAANNMVRNAKYLTYGLTAVMVIMIAITTYFTWKDMCEYYNVKFSPIPHYMVDEKDLIGYNSKGEKVVLKNQSAYYKAVECNRTSTDEMYKTLGTCADMNGDVGRQWLALYAVKNEVMQPILAKSLIVKVFKKPEDVKTPNGYTTGIHMFGSESAFNLNNSYYDWSNSAPGIYVYFKTDDSSASAAGSNFTAGSLAISGGAGLILGAAITAIAFRGKKKKESAAATA